jgi:KRAB domain-containing zinc finger protein
LIEIFLKKLQISKDDSSLPQKICSSCVEKIKIGCEIKQKCLESDEFLRNQKIVEVCEEYVEIIEIDNTQHKPNSDKFKNKRPDKSDYKCYICKQEFDLIAEKNSHVKDAHKNDSKVCAICNKRKPTALSFENHLRFHFFGYRFLCPHCGRNFRYKNLLEVHLKVEHSNYVQYLCDLCGYSTKFKMNLQRHLISFHMKVKGFICAFDECTARYSTQVGLNLHLYRKHNLPAPINCPQCKQGFTFDSEVKIHLKHCTGLPIREKGSLKENPHLDILDNGFRCQICSQIYETRAKWSVHYYHKHKTSNICSICQKQLSSSTSLFKHIRVMHDKIKKYVCGFPGCARSFGFKHSLMYHQNLHTNSKPFKCDICDFSTGDRSCMSKHKKKAHQQKI